MARRKKNATKAALSHYLYNYHKLAAPRDMSSGAASAIPQIRVLSVFEWRFDGALMALSWRFYGASMALSRRLFNRDGFIVLRGDTPVSALKGR